MSALGFTLFDTPIGRCGVVWSDTGIAGLALPGEDERKTREFILRRFPDAEEDAPPLGVARALEDIAALLRGERVLLDSVALDMSGISPFYKRVYDVARSIGPGATLSYGDIAARLGAPGAARAVGQALGKNPFPIVVPCHRVLAAGGRMGGFSAYGGTTTKLRLLSIEGARFGAEPRSGGDGAATRSNGQLSLFGGDGALGFDPALAVRHLRESDADLARLIDDVGPFRMQIKNTSSVFSALSEAIVYQQLTGKAAATIYARLCALFPNARGELLPRHVLESRSEKLRKAGLSRAKVSSLKDLAKKVDKGKLPSLSDLHAMDNDAIIERLTDVRGIGRWTVEMLLMFRLGRPDVLPTDDYGIRKGFAIAYRKRALPEKKLLERFGARWKPYRTVASWYLWRALDLRANS